MPSTDIASLDSGPPPGITLPDAGLPLAQGECPSPLGSVWRFVKGSVVFLIVVFHLGVLAVRNPLDLWYKPIQGWLEEKHLWQKYEERIKLADRFTWKYTNLVGCEQRWVMFSPPMARRAPFFGLRYEFTDGSKEFVRSKGEPNPKPMDTKAKKKEDNYQLAMFIQVGGWQRRKLEEYLIDPPNDLRNDPERCLWEGCAHSFVRQWRQNHPDDPRKIARVVFLKRRIRFPGPEETPGQYDPPIEWDIATFDAQGRLLP